MTTPTDFLKELGMTDYIVNPNDHIENQFYLSDVLTSFYEENLPHNATILQILKECEVVYSDINLKSDEHFKELKYLECDDFIGFETNGEILPEKHRIYINP